MKSSSDQARKDLHNVIMRSIEDPDSSEADAVISHLWRLLETPKVRSAAINAVREAIRLHNSRTPYDGQFVSRAILTALVGPDIREHDGEGRVEMLNDAFRGLGPGAKIRYLAEESDGKYWCELELPEDRYKAPIVMESGDTPEAAVRAVCKKATTFRKRVKRTVGKPIAAHQGWRLREPTIVAYEEGGHDE